MTKQRRFPAGRADGGRFATQDRAEGDTELTPDELPADVRKFLPDGTADTWRKVAPIVPRSAYLAGGTALTVHLKHRISRDLDFMIAGPEDLHRVRQRLERVGKLVVSMEDPDTLNCTLDETKLQWLRTFNQRQLAPTTTVAGIDVASVEDIMAMKLKVVLDRGELRDYFDLMEIDRIGGVSIEEGVSLFLNRYGIDGQDARVAMVVRSLGYLDDVEDDPGLPVDRAVVERFWARRQPQLVASLDRFG